MKNKLNDILVILIPIFLIWFTSSCSTSNLDNAAHSIMVQKNEKLYRDRAMQFIRLAKDGKVESMILYTSQRTIDKSGIENIRRVYENDVIPKFKGAKVQWTRDYIMITDERGVAGIRFSGRATGSLSFQFSIDIFGENGELVIINLKRY